MDTLEMIPQWWMDSTEYEIASWPKKHVYWTDLNHHGLILAGRRYGYYPVATIQIAVCMGTVIASTILGGQSMKVINYLK